MADYFLKLDPVVEGESQDSKHKGEIELESWSFGVSNTSSVLAGQGAGTGAGKSVPGSLTATKKTDRSTPRLAQAVATGDRFKSAIITVRKAGGMQQDYLTITLSEVLISQYQAGGSGNGALPLESISLSYAKLVQEYKIQKSDGTFGDPVTLGFDWSKNVKV